MEIEALQGRSACSLVRAHGASQLMKKPRVSEDLTSVFTGISFSRERCLVRGQGEAGSEQTVGKDKGLGRDGAGGERDGIRGCSLRTGRIGQRCRGWGLISCALVTSPGKQEAEPLHACQSPGLHC